MQNQQLASLPKASFDPSLGKVPFFDGSVSFRRIWPEVQEQLVDMFEHGKFSHGIIVERLEEAMKQYTGAKYTLGVNSGTDALVLMLRALGIGRGDEVIVPTYTFFASASSIALAGATPVFVDVDAKSYSIDVEDVERKITSRTKAIMPVHLFHQMADMTSIQAIADKHNLLVVEDSAEAIGMQYGRKHAGRLGIGGALSFFPTKTLGALGDAGMILTDNADLAQKVKCTRHHGRRGQTLGYLPGIANEAMWVGTNSKMDDIQAAVLLVKLRYLDQDIEKRSKLAERYTKFLSAVEQVQTPSVLPRGEQTTSVYYTYVVHAQEREALVNHLSKQGIQTEVYYPKPLHLQECFKTHGYRRGDFPCAENLSNELLALPFYPDLTDEQLTFVCETITSFYQSRRSTCH